MTNSEYLLVLSDTLQFTINITGNDSWGTPGVPAESLNASGQDIVVQAHFVNYILYVVGVLVTSATVVGNVLVIIAVITDKRLRKVGNVFIINLAVSDCLVGICVSPLAISYDIAGDWLLGDVMCDIWISLDVICCTASILNLSAIAYDRYKAITKPIKYSRQRTFCRAWLVVLLVWLYSILIALPRFLGWRKKDEFDLDGMCFISREIGYTIFSTCAAFFLPLVIMLFFYYKIYCATCVRKKSWTQHHGHCNFITESERAEKANALCFLCNKLSCCSPKPTTHITTTEQSTQTSNYDVHQLSNTTTDIGEEVRHESIEPEILAIFQMRQRSNRMLSNATMSSFGSTFYSSTDSSNTATTSFSESSDRSSSISTECRDRSYSTCTTGSRSFSSGSDYVRRHSAFRGHRLSNPRHSTLQTEVIHEIASQLEKTISETCHPGEVARHPDTTEMEETHDEASDDDKHKTKTRKALKSSTFRRKNSRKSKKMALNQDKRAARTLCIVMGCFTVCWLPFFVVALLRSLCVNCYFHPLIIKSISWLGYLNSACNPFIYTFFNKDFRNAFKKLSCCRSERVVYL